MELPAALRRAIDLMLEGTPLADLRQAAGALSQRYRAETRDGRYHLDAEGAVRAYLAARMPATFGAVRAGLDAVAQAAPDFRPSTLLDAGAGPGTVLWAAADLWPGLARATLIEGSAQVRRAGERLAQGAALPRADWLAGEITDALPHAETADLVTLSYVLDELPPAAIAPVVTRLWALTKGVLLIVEPGTPAGWRRILLARDTLIANAAAILAPCPHDAACPLAAPDWCHFAQRVARSRMHRLAKGGDVAWEDEKFIYVAAARTSAAASWSRVLAPPRQASGMVGLKLCRPDGTVESRLATRREGQVFKAARKVQWGDAADLP